MLALDLELVKFSSIFTFVSLRGRKMINKAFSKKLMLAVGILAALVILFTQAFQPETASFLSKIKANKTEKPTEAEKDVIIATPSEAVTSSQAVEVGDTDPSLIREIVLDEDHVAERPGIFKEFISVFFKTLFRVYISPQAP